MALAEEGGGNWSMGLKRLTSWGQLPQPMIEPCACHCNHVQLGWKCWLESFAKQDCPSRLVAGENGTASPIPSGHYLWVQASQSGCLSLRSQGQQSLSPMFLLLIHPAQELPCGKTIHIVQRAWKGEQIPKEEIYWFWKNQFKSKPKTPVLFIKTNKQTKG